MGELLGRDELDEARSQAQAALERAVGEGRLTLDEFTERVGQVWSADSQARLDVVIGDLPAVPAAQPASSNMVGIFGDVKRKGRWSLPSRVNAWLLFGDAKLDLRDAVITEREVTVNAYSVFGDLVVTVPEGVRVEVTGFTPIGDKKIDLAAVPTVAGGPLIKVRAVTVFGDVRVRSRRSRDRSTAP